MTNTLITASSHDPTQGIVIIGGALAAAYTLFVVGFMIWAYCTAEPGGEEE